MSLYSERLAHLKKEIAQERAKRKKRKKKFTPNQLIMINFIDGITKEAVFAIRGAKVILRKGDKNKGFVHILVKHYCSGYPGEIQMLDILNFDLYLQRAIPLNQAGVSNTDLAVYQYIKGLQSYKIVLKEFNNGEFVVTFYALT